VVDWWKLAVEVCGYCTRVRMQAKTNDKLGSMAFFGMVAALSTEM